MSETVIVALITSILGAIPTIITVIMTNSKTVYRIEQLEKKQEKHNSVIERVYALEKEQDVIEEKIRVSNHRIDDIEHKLT